MARSKPRPKKRLVTASNREDARLSETDRILKHKSFSLSHAPTIDNSGIPSSFNLLIKTIKHLYRYRWRNFFFVLSYGIWWYLLTKNDINTTAGAVYGTVFGCIASLASIWLIRHREAGERATIRLAYYRGMVQLIPFFLVLVVLMLQLMPSYVGLIIYQTVEQTGVAVSTIETAFVITIWIFLSAVSMYWGVATLMSLYIATIPGTFPLDALRSGVKLVEGRRWFVLRRVLLGSLLTVAIYSGLTTLFSSLGWTFVLQQLAIVYPMVFLPVGHTYIYKLYNSLLKKP